ncbi:MAG: YdcF family protein [Leptolyngbya sp. SIO3F4]|nr:YdcF family protein [Leptolyngbya sp. SIO3F4]
MFFSLPLYQWGQFKYALLDWFTDPKRVLVPLLAILLVIFFLRASVCKRLLFHSVCSLSVAYLLLISPLGAKATTRGLTLFLSPDLGQTADAIVILGRGSLAEQERTQAAEFLWRAKRAPIILTTGRWEAPRLSAQLIRLGIPADVQLVEPQARTTEENALRSFELLQSIEANRLLLVTDQPHMLRSVLTFQRLGFEIIPYPVTVPSSLPSIEKTALALREYVGLVSYALIGRLQFRSTPVAVLEITHIKPTA